MGTAIEKQTEVDVARDDAIAKLAKKNRDLENRNFELELRLEMFSETTLKKKQEELQVEQKRAFSRLQS